MRLCLQHSDTPIYSLDTPCKWEILQSLLALRSTMHVSLNDHYVSLKALWVHMHDNICAQTCTYYVYKFSTTILHYNYLRFYNIMWCKLIILCAVAMERNHTQSLDQ